MFGQNDKNEEHHDAQHDEAAQDQPVNDTPQDSTPVQNDQQQPWQHPGTPIDAEHAAAVEPAVPQPEHHNPDATEPTFVSNDLAEIKQQALTQLSPLVGHLEQAPEDRFKTLMMMIQASDDQTLVKEAYETAGKIEDEKVRAQALLDIVNEINYFTTQHHDG